MNEMEVATHAARADSLRRENVSLTRRINIMAGEIERAEQANRDLARRCEKLSRENAEMKVKLAALGVK